MQRIIENTLDSPLQESFLENPNYKASSTNSDEINKLVNEIITNVVQM